jgi:hypothetical protein
MATVVTVPPPRAAPGAGLGFVGWSSASTISIAAEASIKIPAT